MAAKRAIKRSSSEMACGVAYHNIALENARKHQGIARVLELKPKSDLAARKEGQLAEGTIQLV